MLALGGCQTATPVPELTPTGTVAGSWMLEVESPGPHWLGPGWFRTRGLDPNLTPEQVQLHLGQQLIPYLLLGGPEGTGLLFYAFHAPSRYASWTAYRLDVGQGSGQVMASAPTPKSLAAETQDTAWASLWQEQDLQYRPQISAPEPWFWEPLYSGERLTHTVTLTQAVAGPITLTLRLWSRGMAPGDAAPPRLWWDGEQVATWREEGPEEQSWPAVLLGSDPGQEHTLALELPEQADGSMRRVWLDGWGITFRRPLTSTMPSTIWLAEEREATIPGAEGTRLLDVTDPRAPLDLGQVEGEQILTQPGQRYWVGLPWLAPGPARARPLATVEQADLDGADYLIVAPEPFWTALEPLVQHRQGQGLTVSRLTPAQVYDTYGDGRPDPEAIRSLVQQLHDRGRLRYLLLVGDAATRPDEYAGKEGALLVVTDLTPTLHLHETPSDQAMIIDESGQPLVAVGRFPAQTADQVETMVAKTLQWEETGLSSILLLSDDQPDFGHFAEVMAPVLPTVPQRLDAAEKDARPRALEQLQQQGVWLNYVGHGSLALWGDEKLLQRDDEWSEPAAVTVWACLSGYFVHPTADSLAEVWLRSPQGGAAVFVGPTGETYLYQQQLLAQTFYQEIQAGQPVGDALLAAWQAAGDSAQDAVRSYLLLGDPALRLYAP